MNAAQARERVAKLQALADPTRGGTDAERAVAAAKAEKLIREHKLDRNPPRASRYDPRLRRRPTRTYTASPSGVVTGTFDVRTGEATGNIRVHDFRDRANWKIEIIR